MAVIEFVDRDVHAKKVDIKKKTTTKDDKEEKKGKIYKKFKNIFPDGELLEVSKKD